MEWCGVDHSNCCLMKRLLLAVAFALAPLICLGQVPIQRNPFTTNTAANANQFAATSGTVSIKSGVTLTNGAGFGTWNFDGPVNFDDTVTGVTFISSSFMQTF